MRNIHTTKLMPGDIVIKENDKGEIIDYCYLKEEIPVLGCNGRHFIQGKHQTSGSSLVCYGPGIVTILGNR